jgi:hypothetical protein
MVDLRWVGFYHSYVVFLVWGFVLNFFFCVYGRVPALSKQNHHRNFWLHANKFERRRALSDNGCHLDWRVPRFQDGVLLTELSPSIS